MPPPPPETLKVGSGLAPRFSFSPARSRLRQQRRNRAKARGPRFLLLLLVIATHALGAPLAHLDGLESELGQHIQAPATLVLLVSRETDLRDAQRLLTLAYSQEQPALILVVLPDKPIKAAAIRRAAKRFFDSGFSRDRVYLLQQANHPHPGAKTLLLAPDSKVPLYQSPTFPQTLPTAPQP